MPDVLNSISMEEFEEYHDFFNSLYDVVRVVDPEHCKVMECHEGAFVDADERCYTCWEKGKLCKNCISAYAAREKKSTIKFEMNDNSVIMVTAIPLIDLARPCVLELLQDVTESLLFHSGSELVNRLISNELFELSEKAVKDHLTSLYNRRFIDDRLPMDVINAKLHGAPLSVMFFDIDDFKPINDTHGHEVGDAVLKAFAEALDTCIRADCDWAARYGGDEFFICLNGIDSDAAVAVAERVREHVERIVIPVEGEEIRITSSTGIHTVVQGDISSEAIIRLADKRMYESKTKGKNHITYSLD